MSVSPAVIGMLCMAVGGSLGLNAVLLVRQRALIDAVEGRSEADEPTVEPVTTNRSAPVKAPVAGGGD